MKLTEKEEKIARLALDKAAKAGERQAAAAKLIESLYARGVKVEDILKETVRVEYRTPAEPKVTRTPPPGPVKPAPQEWVNPAPERPTWVSRNFARVMFWGLIALAGGIQQQCEQAAKASKQTVLVAPVVPALVAPRPKASKPSPCPKTYTTDDINRRLAEKGDHSFGLNKPYVPAPEPTPPEPTETLSDINRKKWATEESTTVKRAQPVVKRTQPVKRVLVTQPRATGPAAQRHADH
jgi:hypothetical protein